MYTEILLMLAALSSPLSLAGWTSLASENSPVIVRAEAGIMEADAKYRETRASLLPNLSLSLSTGYSWVSVAGGEAGIVESDQSYSSAGLVLSQKLLDSGGSTWISLQAASIGEELAEMEYSSAILEVKRTIAERFYSAVSATRFVYSRRAALIRSNGLLERTQTMFDLGAASSLDLLSARIVQTEDQVNLLQSKQQLDQALSRLRQAAGVTGDSSLTVDTTSVLLPLTLEEVESLPVEIGLNYSVAGAYLERNMADLSLNSARRKWMPSLSLSGSWNWTGEEFDLATMGETDSWDVRVTLAVPVFDGWQRSSRIQSARASLLRADANTQSTVSEITTSIGSAEETLISAINSLELAELRLQYSRERMELSELHYYELGDLNLTDFLEAHSALVSAEAGFISARIDCLIAEVNYLALIGISPRVGE